MNLSSGEYVTSQRLARYYLERLYHLSEQYLQGGNNVSRALAGFEFDWLQIHAAQRWTSEHITAEPYNAELCNAFADRGSLLLNIRRTADDQFEWIEAGLRAAQLLNSPRSKASHLVHKGDVYMFIGQYPEAIACYEQGLAIGQELAEETVQTAALIGLKQCAILKEKATLSSIHRDTEQRLKQANPASQEALERVQTSALILQRKFKEALEALNGLLAKSRAAGDLYGEIEHLANTGRVYIGMENHRTAVTALEQALTLARQLGSKAVESNVLGTLASSYYVLGKYERSINTLEQAIAVARVLGNPHHEAGHLYNLGACYMQVGKYNEARAAFEAAAVLFDALDMPERAATTRQHAQTATGDSAVFRFLLRNFTRAVHKAHLNNVVLWLKDRIDKK